MISVWKRPEFDRFILYMVIELIQQSLYPINDVLNVTPEFLAVPRFLVTNLEVLLKSSVQGGQFPVPLSQIYGPLPYRFLGVLAL